MVKWSPWILSQGKNLGYRYMWGDFVPGRSPKRSIQVSLLPVNGMFGALGR